jgi:predicted nucleic acid-binding protein
MKKVKIYFDTSVISFLFADDSPDFKSITINFFENYSKEYDLYISEIVLLEINKNPDELLKTDMLNIIDKYNIQTLEYNLEIDEIAKKYILSKIIPERKIEDALHVAYTTYYEIDILLSWNFKHLANIKKEYEE